MKINSSDPFDLDERVAVVTGGGRGIGLGIAHALANRGAKLILVGRNVDALGAAADGINTSTGRDTAVPLAADVSNEAEVEELAKAVVDMHGRLDILVNNAGVNPIYKEIGETSMEEWRHIVDINLGGVFLCCKHLSTIMLTAGTGSIINISSIAGHVGLRKSAPYCASKGAVEILTKSLALDWAAKGIRVNCIAPGFFETDLTAGMRDHDHIAKRLLAHTPMARFGSMNDIGDVAVFLASDASAYMTGQSLVVDGGWTAD